MITPQEQQTPEQELAPEAVRARRMKIIEALQYEFELEQGRLALLEIEISALETMKGELEYTASCLEDAINSVGDSIEDPLEPKPELANENILPQTP